MPGNNVLWWGKAKMAGFRRVPLGAFCSLLEECVDDKKTLRKVETLLRGNSSTIV